MTRTEVEEAILGTILLDNRAYDAIENELMVGDFCDETLGWIFEWFTWEILKGNPVGLLDLKAAQKKCGTLGDGKHLERIATAMVIPGRVVDWVHGLRRGEFS